MHIYKNSVYIYIYRHSDINTNNSCINTDINVQLYNHKIIYNDDILNIELCLYICVSVCVCLCLSFNTFPFFPNVFFCRMNHFEFLRRIHVGGWLFQPWKVEKPLKNEQLSTVQNPSLIPFCCLV